MTRSQALRRTVQTPQHPCHRFHRVVERGRPLLGSVAKQRCTAGFQNRIRGQSTDFCLWMLIHGAVRITSCIRASGTTSLCFSLSRSPTFHRPQYVSGNAAQLLPRSTPLQTTPTHRYFSPRGRFRSAPGARRPHEPPQWRRTLQGS